MTSHSKSVTADRVVLPCLCALLPLAGAAWAGPDACVAGVCQGNQSAGVSMVPPPTSQSVINLSTDIAPTSGTPGIRFLSQGNLGHDGEMLPIHGTNADGGGAGSPLILTVTAPTRSIVTHGTDTYGVSLTSTGGNGGVGGVGFFLLITPGFGGRGGSGGNGGAIVGTIEAREIHTWGANATGVLATSQAGNGGNGGYAVGLYGSGGDGGIGGTGGNISLTTHGAIVTEGVAAAGIAAQSSGGTGGNGGNGDGIVGSGGTSFGSGPGGTISITNWAAITTKGSESQGIFAESVGGQSGSGGRSGGLVSFGSGANSAGDGGPVGVTNHGSITTGGSEAHAIVAHSAGGGGGTAGNSFGLLGSVGGDGGASGNGGNINVNNDAVLTTTGSDAIGIFAESVGGGGGLGGKGAGLFSFGGDGSASGKGGDIAITNSGTIHSTASSIVANSIGGGGGSGGTAGGMLVTHGGKGGSGGNGGIITIDNSGSLTTSQIRAPAISAWSTGGGGGAGAGSDSYGIIATFAYGGSGSGGGNGGDITVHHSGATIQTAGERSHGIDAVSLGGGGGKGGDAMTLEGAIIASLSDSVGGTGGGGGYGGTVKVGETGASFTGSITTSGDAAHGIRGVSIGGGGGDGGESLLFSFTGPGPGVPFAVSASISLGGSGGSGGYGGDTKVNNAALIDTSGFRSQGIFAESVGGGGGEGGQSFVTTVVGKVSADATISLGGKGGSGGAGHDVQINNTGAIVTRGDFANGILSQSIGGGGGAGGTSASLRMGMFSGPLPGIDGTAKLVLGGTGGAGGAGGSVTVTNHAGIDTYGSFGNGILAQSIGAGGGYGGLKIDTDYRLGFTGLHVDMTLGASETGSAGDGGGVTVDQRGAIHTRGDFANAILAQSVGGGGGYAATSIQDGDTDVGIPSATIHGGLMGSGSGAAVMVTSNGNLTTDGKHAFGILAQSTGGGGGYAAVRILDNFNKSAMNPSLFLYLLGIDGDSLVQVGSAGGTGSGGSVDVSHTGNITTQGIGSHGIVAISAGGGGDDVTVSVTGNVNANGADASGVLARSGSSGDIRVSLLDGLIRGGSGSGTGITFDGGRNNLLTNRGSISALSGLAVLGGGGNETIDNRGVLTGNVDLGAGSNRIDNQTGARFLPGSKVSLGTGGVLNNAGRLSPGGDNHVATTALNGKFNQTGTGLYAIDLDTRSLTADRLDMTGLATLAGTTSVNLLRRGFVRPGSYSLDLLTSAQSVNGRFDSVVLPMSTPLLHYSLAYSPAAVQLQIQTASIRSVATNPVGDVVSSHLDQIAPTVSGNLADAIGEIQGLTNPADHSRAFTSLSPEAYGGMTQAGLAMSGARVTQLQAHMEAIRLGNNENAATASRTFSVLPLAYAGPGQFYAAGGNYARNGDRGVWLDVVGHKGDLDTTAGHTGYQHRFSGMVMGFDQHYKSGALFGVALGYGNSDLHYDAATGNAGISDRQLALYGSYPVGGGWIDAILSHAHQDYDMTRNLVIGSTVAQANSRHTSSVLAAALTGRTQFPLGSWQIEPFAGLRYTQIDEKGFSESGVGGLGLIVPSRRTEYLSAEVGARFQTVVKRPDGDLIPSLLVSLDHDFRIDSQSVTAAYLDAPGSSFTIPGGHTSPNGVKLALGLAHVTAGGLRSSLRLDTEQRHGYHAYGLFGAIRYEF